MLFKLSVNNIKKSIRDYVVYFFTLIVGVAVFYVFNAIQAQTVMMNLTDNMDDIIEMMVSILSGVSVFVAVILGFLIIYATRFLIKRRNREFGLYMLLGMSKRKISLLLFGETFLIGLISLGIGLVVGVCASQFMSILVAHLFSADMERFQFVFSKGACVRTLLYFGLMYAIVIVFNTVMVSRYQLIDLMQSKKRSEKVRIKNPWICVIVFIISVLMLGCAYYYVTDGIEKLSSPAQINIPIVLGAVATFLLFWSLSGLVLKILTSWKRVYYRGLNTFVFRQFASKINTMVTSMTIICLMLFVTICVLSSALSMNHAMNDDINEQAPVDVNLSKERNLDNSWSEQGYSKEDIKNSKIPLLEEYKKKGIYLDKYLGDYVAYSMYSTDELTLGDTLGSRLEKIKEIYSALDYGIEEEIMSVSDYNRVAKLYGNKTFSLKDDEYMIVGDFESVTVLRDEALKEGEKIQVFGHTFKPKYDHCQKGHVEISANPSTGGIILLPDDAIDPSCVVSDHVAGNYMSQDKAKAEQALKKEFGKVNITYSMSSRQEILEGSIGMGTMVVFIGIYLGIVFLISCAAILALKELSESADNIERYDMLRKIGADEKMISRALFFQIGIFFLFPLVLACIHSYFGIRFCNLVLASFGKEKMLRSVVETVGVLIIIYGGYFLMTYVCSKNMIQKK